MEDNKIVKNIYIDDNSYYPVAIAIKKNIFTDYGICAFLTENNEIGLIGDFNCENSFHFSIDNYAFEEEDVIKSFPKYKNNIKIYLNDYRFLFKEGGFYICKTNYITTFSSYLNREIGVLKFEDLQNISIKKIILYDEKKDSLYFEEVKYLYKTESYDYYFDLKNKLLLDFIDIENFKFTIPNPIKTYEYTDFNIISYDNLYELEFNYFEDFSILVSNKIMHKNDFQKSNKNLKFTKTDINDLMSTIGWSLYHILSEFVYDNYEINEIMKNEIYDFCIKEFNKTNDEVVKIIGFEED